MGDWIEYAPAGGWAVFTRGDALTNALWDRLPADDWQFLSFVDGSAVWESRRDASLVSAHYEGERFVHLAAQGGAAWAVVSPLAAEFGLAPAEAPDSEPGAAADGGGM